jgi:tyrosine-protein kinase Etk/Wzc
MMQNQQEDILKTGTDFQKIVDTFLNYKKVYILCVGIALAIAMANNMLSRPTYRNSTTIYFSEQDNANLLSSRDAMEGFRFLSNQTDVENEMELIRSFTLIREVLLRLNYHVGYYRDYSSFPKKYLKGKEKYLEEIHSNLPFRVNIDKSHPQVVYSLFKVKILDNKRYVLTSTAENKPLFNYIDNQQLYRIDAYSISDTLYFNERLQHPYFSFEIASTEALNKGNYGKEYYFRMFDINHLAADYQRRLTPALVSPQATLIKITLVGGNIEKITDFLNELTSIYLDVNVEKKNKIARSTIDFIDGQISQVADSLVKAETNLRDFRSSNKVMDLSFQGQEFFRLMNELETEKAQIAVQIRYYEYLKEYFSKEQDIAGLRAPSTMNIVDPILTELIASLLELNAERNRIMDGDSRENLFLDDMNRQIDNLLANISENVENNMNTLNITKNEIEYRINKLSNQISRMPKTELQLRGIEREFEINDEIYTFLLQKRAESQIVRASNFPDYEIVDPARVLSYNPIGPRKKVNLAIAIILGILLPYSFLTVKDLLTNTISKHEDIEALSNVPILGNVFHNDSKATNVIKNASDSAVAESFRALHMNFDFLTKGNEQSVITVSSSLSGEGKTFTAINMANTFASFGKKTVLIEYDLRRPSISKVLKLNSQIGTTSYLINKSLLEDIIIKTEDPNLDIITAGPIPPNPSVLIASDKTKELIDLLLNYYDIVLIDSAPVGVVAETKFLMDLSNINLVIARYNKTLKNVFKNTIKNLQKNNIGNLTVVINDVSMKSHSYKYTYDKKYYHAGAKKKKRISIPRIKKS